MRYIVKIMRAFLPAVICSLLCVSCTPYSLYKQSALVESLPNSKSVARKIESQLNIECRVRQIPATKSWGLYTGVETSAPYTIIDFSEARSDLPFMQQRRGSLAIGNGEGAGLVEFSVGWRTRLAPEKQVTMARQFGSQVMKIAGVGHRATSESIPATKSDAEQKRGRATRYSAESSR